MQNHQHSGPETRLKNIIGCLQDRIDGGKATVALSFTLILASAPLLPPFAKPKSICGLMGSLQLSYGETNKPQWGYRAQGSSISNLTLSS